MSNTSSLSRLDQVFALLENGGSQITRKAAAKQLGDVQKKHPQELNNLLAKLLTYTKHEDWNVRISTSEAIESIISEVPIWEPKPTIKTENVLPQKFTEDKLSFKSFDVDRVLNGSQLLLGSSGEEYKISEDFKGLDSKARIINQRKVLEKKLGLNFAGNAGIGVSSNDLFDDIDLESNSKPNIKIENLKEEKKLSCTSVISQLSEGLSSREKNRAKRKAKLLLKQMSRDGHQKKENEERDCQPSAKKRKKGEKGCAVEPEINLDLIPPHNPLIEEWSDWPLEWITSELMNSLFSQNWEERHGACIALKVIIKKHGKGCGKVKGMNADQLENYHQSWLIDLSVRLLCVITVDRFADYVSDQVVAPVRESCAQTLSVVVGNLNKTSVHEVLKILLYLNTKHEWEIRQSSMLAIQYIIAIRQDLQDEILCQCFPIILNGLQDKDGDVKSVSAKSLMPTTLLLTKNPKYQNELHTLLTILWESLKVYDELTASTQSIMILLSKLIQEIPRQAISTEKNLPILVSRLWPFLHHVVVSVREAALITLTNIIGAGNKEEENNGWLSHISVDACWNLFQCCLLESDCNVREKAAQVFELFVRKCPSLSETYSHISNWMSLSCQPQGTSFDITMLIQHNNNNKICEGGNNDQPKLMGGSSFRCSGDYDAYVMTTREYIARMIGQVCCNLVKTQTDSSSSLQAIFQQLNVFMTSQSAMQRIAASMVLKFWWEECNETNTMFPLCNELHSVLTQTQQDSLYYSEVTIVYIQVQTDIKALVNNIQQKGINLQCFPFKPVYSFNEVQNFCEVLFSQIITKPDKVLQNQRDLLLKLTTEAQKSQTCLDDHVKVYIASCLVSAAQSSGENQWKLPEKLNPIIRPLMETLKRETNATVCKTISITLTRLMGLCKLREKSPNAKLVNNLCNSLISSTIRCPTSESIMQEFNEETLKTCNLPPSNLKHDALITQLRRTAACICETSSKRKKKLGSTVDVNDNDTSTVVASKGAQCCFETIFKVYGNKVFDALPQLWNLIQQICTLNIATNGVETNQESNPNVVDKSLIISQSLSLMQVAVPALDDSSLQDQFLSILPHITSFLCHGHSPVRFMSSRCLATMTKHFPDKIMPIVVEQILPNFDRIDDVVKRKGTIELVANIIETMEHDVVPYTVLLVVPLLGRMSDHDIQIRLLSTYCFAKLIQYMPVESSIPDPPNLPPSLVEKKQKERRFLEQLFDCSSLDEYEVPVVIKATLRSYQEDGVKWLAFLNRYKLHGVLCDDMGLGKTLQTICIMSSDHYYKQHNIKGNPGCPRLISLVVCPPTLTGHWVEEVSKFCDCFEILHYYGSPLERQKLQEGVSRHNLVVASYDVVRNDIQFFSKIKWNYCVLDEGHAIRNGKSKTAISIKSLISNHRLILSGTPIQNSVLELWSLFDFLMPGFLGSAQEFNHRYTKPILNSREAKSSSKEQEEGLLAMESLHRQVLPFMLRRMKEDVLKDLPPKTIQDYYCDLSPLQLQLYEDFAKTRAKKDAESSIHNSNDESARSKGTSHVFQALQYLQKVCNHPLFVLTPSHPHYNSTIAQLKQKNSSLHDIKHSSKLVALHQLLIDCGIGISANENPGLEVSVVNQHRCLIFCQHRNMLDIIEHDLFKGKMKTVTFLRLDGSIPTNQRYSITSKFNNDPSIDVLLLTTKVGGLGLNLTGADTVIFVEHDWNPMVDLQAMDRAHRIGQKRTVNVYRLITRGTLEQKILGLQKFKLKVADAVLGEDNRGLHSMGTNQVLDLFSVNKGSSKESKPQQQNAEVSKGFRAMIDSLEDLWDQNQYDEEYNLDKFMHSLK